jgi:hypothetical protein
MNAPAFEINSENPQQDGASLRITWEALYEKVWSQPMVQVAKEFGISERELAKALNARRFARRRLPQHRHDLLHRVPALRLSKGPCPRSSNLSGGTRFPGQAILELVPHSNHFEDQLAALAKRGSRQRDSPS